MSTSTKFMIIITAFCLVAIWVKSILQILLALAIAPKFGLRCQQIKILWWTFTYEDGKWNCSTDHFSLVFQYNVTIDISKPVPPDIDKKEKSYTAICTAILVAVGLIVFALCRDNVAALTKWDSANVADLFAGSFAIGMVYHSLVSVVINIYTYQVIMKRLGGYVDVLTKRMRRGEDFEALNLKPVSQLPYANPSKLEKMFYYNVYIPYLIALDRTDELREPIEEMTKHFRGKEYILQETLSYYWLIFYYSRYEINEMYADGFLKKVWPTMAKDNDANAKRVLAYYYYGVKGNIEKAQQYIQEGLSCVDKFSLPGAERELERKLLTELDAIIARRLSYEQQNLGE